MYKSKYLFHLLDRTNCCQFYYKSFGYFDKVDGWLTS